jgi:hypothetical protein
VAIGLAALIERDNEILNAFMQDEDIGFHLSDIEEPVSTSL